MSFVLDASVTVARLNRTEATPAVLAVFDRLAHEHAVVPALWWLEVANALQMGLRRKRYAVADRDRYLAFVANLPIETDSQSPRGIVPLALALSDRHGLTLYDAAYLELALRRGLPLATLDRDLRSAAAAEQVPLLGL